MLHSGIVSVQWNPKHLVGQESELGYLQSSSKSCADVELRRTRMAVESSKKVHLGNMSAEQEIESCL